MVPISSKIGSMEEAKDCLHRSPGKKRPNVRCPPDLRPARKWSSWQVSPDRDSASRTNYAAVPNPLTPSMLGVGASRSQQESLGYMDSYAIE